jgi:hypothetical protein
MLSYALSPREAFQVGSDATELEDCREFPFKGFCLDRPTADADQKPPNPEMSLFDGSIYSRYIIENVPRGSKPTECACSSDFCNRYDLNHRLKFIDRL